MRLLFIFLVFFCASLQAQENPPPPHISDLPVAYKGRFRPLEAYSRLWLDEIYGSEHVKRKDFNQFQQSNDSAISLLWKLHFEGITSIANAPLIYIGSQELKAKLSLDAYRTNFSYQELQHILDELFIANQQSEDETNLLTQFNLLRVMKGSNSSDDKLEKFFAEMKDNYSERDLAQLLEQSFPYYSRLVQVDSLFKLLPSKRRSGEWLPLKALKVKVYDPTNHQLKLVENFTVYSNQDFNEIRYIYLSLEKAFLSHSPDVNIWFQKLENKLLNSYQTVLAGRVYQVADSKSLMYPSMQQLALESFYYKVPLILITITFYLISLLFLSVNQFKHKKWIFAFGLGSLIIAYMTHTSVIALRSYILMRPPVTNMAETIIYVPWIVSTIGLGLWLWYRQGSVLVASVVSSLSLLVILELLHLSSGLENVQAVLDSQYWLLIHVLMVVASYGLFILGGILGHVYFFSTPSNQKNISCIVLQCLYMGIALLIPGTILGGVWAAESWGRFWDWDPKESWAFISACIYLIVIHAYTFNFVRSFGLAIGSIVGLLAISFTWYGVNYLLGTGLHSYGFGTGGQIYYFLYLGIEVLFLGIVSFKKKIESKELI